jgi:signal transduction histidine kinase
LTGRSGDLAAVFAPAHGQLPDCLRGRLSLPYARAPRRDHGKSVDFARIFEQGPSRKLVVTPGAPFNIGAVSDAYLEVTLTTRDIVGRPLFDVFPDNPRDPSATGVSALAASFERALAARATDVMPVQRYDIRDRSGMFIERHWTPINTTIIGEDGTRLGIIHRVEDVTPFVQEGEALRGEATSLKHEILTRARDLGLANAALHESIEQRRRIVAIVGHDLRTPLSSICSGVQILRAHFKKLGADPPRTLEILQSVSARMAELLADLDDYTVSQLRGVLPVSRRWVNLREVCEEVVDAVAVAHPDRAIELEPGENIGAFVDPKRKRQVLTNLINNAVAYGASHRPVRVSLRRITGGCVITVSNEGEPIPRDLLPSLFEPFRRGPGIGSASTRGHLGLGLFIVQQIVHAHGGRIDVESTDRGTHFMVFVPIG